MDIIRAYLDIETTGCSQKYHDLTVIGIAIERPETIEVIQLVGHDITTEALNNVLADAGIIYTYNGRRFDLPFIKNKLQIDLERQFRHRDLMYDCWKNKLKGGLKAVEQKLEIGRQTKGIDGWMAVRLWWDYINNNDAAALQTLLAYNREDVVNLKTLRLKLGVE
jgi:uncharacterized protein YprB with RNaseH-like and TPR domain